MFERKLSALQYEASSIDLNNETDFKNLVYWLENMKIRFYPIENRGPLLPDSQTWNVAFEKYLTELKCYFPRDNQTAIVDWLLNLALRYEMEDMREKLKMTKNEMSDVGNTGGKDLAKFDSNVVSSPEFLAGLRDLSQFLNVPYHDQDPMITLRAIAILLCKLKQSSTSDVSKDSNQDGQKNKKKKLSSQLDESILNRPFQINVNKNQTKADAVLNRCANVLRLLYIKDLRDLQTQINNIIVQIQSITAVPKTDTTLGRIGR